MRRCVKEGCQRGSRLLWSSTLSGIQFDHLVPGKGWAGVKDYQLNIAPASFSAMETCRKSCSAVALLRAEQGPCEPSKDFVSKFGEQ